MIAGRARTEGDPEDEVERRTAQDNPLGHIIDARETPYVVTFSASPKSIAINEDVIADGGSAGRMIHY